MQHVLYSSFAFPVSSFWECLVFILRSKFISLCLGSGGYIPKAAGPGSISFCPLTTPPRQLDPQFPALVFSFFECCRIRAMPQLPVFGI